MNRRAFRDYCDNYTGPGSDSEREIRSESKLYRFFLPDAPAGDTVQITGEDANHIGYALRMKPGENLVLTHGGVDYYCTIVDLTRNMVTASINKTEASRGEPSIKLTLYQSIPKGEKMEQIIQKSTEIGIHKIVPFISERTIVRPASLSMRTERWNKIALAAAKQSGRAAVPIIVDILRFEDILGEFGYYDTVMFCNEAGGERISLPSDAKNIALIVGCEGGFSAREREEIVEAGATSVTLGSRILRAETAPLVAASIIMYLSSEDDVN
jgi:16S rRNA (uracil1498-N3)-methyltransferase